MKVDVLLFVSSAGASSGCSCGRCPALTMPVRERPGADERLVGGFREGMAVEYNSFSRGGW